MNFSGRVIMEHFSTPNVLNDTLNTGTANEDFRPTVVVVPGMLILKSWMHRVEEVMERLYSDYKFVIVRGSGWAGGAGLEKQTKAIEYEMRKGPVIIFAVSAGGISAVAAAVRNDCRNVVKLVTLDSPHGKRWWFIDRGKEAIGYKANDFGLISRIETVTTTEKHLTLVGQLISDYEGNGKSRVMDTTSHFDFRMSTRVIEKYLSWYLTR